MIVEARDIEPGDISRIKALVSEVKWEPMPGNFASFALFDPRLGKVRVFSDAPAAEFSDIVDQFPREIVYEGRALSTLSRQADYQSHWGGAQMVEPGSEDPYNCTSGFSVRNINLNPRMVTASHCFDLDTTVNSPGGSTFGTVQRRDDFPTNDFELVGGGGVNHGPSIYVGGSTGTQAKVTSGGLAGMNFEYCFSGATSYENCDLYMVASDAMLCYNQACTIGTTHVQVFDGPPGKGSCGGDSGAPFYRYGSDGNVQIRGIVIAGDALEGQACLDNGELVIVEKWTKIQDTYDVTIKTIYN